MKNVKECSCFIRHASSDEEYSAAIDRLTYSRQVGDGMGIMLALAEMGRCPSRTAEHNHKD
jgi:hypothetical protein